jgi:hypothetical protein
MSNGAFKLADLVEAAADAAPDRPALASQQVKRSGGGRVGLYAGFCLAWALRSARRRSSI